MIGTVNLPLLSAMAVLGGVVVTLLDGRRAVSIAAVVAALALAPTAAAVGGPTPGLLLLAAAVATLTFQVVADRVARMLPRSAGLDPQIPVFAPRQALFGPRAARVAGAAVMLPAASWVSFNIAIGSQAGVSGLLFPAAYVALCATLRLFMARAIADIGVALAALGIAIATAWVLRGGSEVAATIPVVLTLVAGLVMGWEGGRHAQRNQPSRHAAAASIADGPNS